ncbi:hypothetical protein [Nitratiruptor sp. YY09-18]|uniref:hypothetical protein n=1 Tax=Nitratiruptor sp. YY09-18 TaxID=2724901 RepID=UPI00191599E0|nr:hypothetical protein [Nitratiruptor sp. YY09-18]BCD67761.1 hypothetical protein NitYY0918_C0668 [Nitratiruptor sp. YY09-18]
MKNIFLFSIIALLFVGCTQETQNKLGRAIVNWTGTNGVLEIYSGGKVVKRIMGIDKISTAYGTDDNRPRPYRYGYGYLDANLDGVLQKEEKRKKIYFEFSDYATQYLFYEHP